MESNGGYKWSPTQVTAEATTEATTHQIRLQYKTENPARNPCRFPEFPAALVPRPPLGLASLLWCGSLVSVGAGGDHQR